MVRLRSACFTVRTKNPTTASHLASMLALHPIPSVTLQWLSYPSGDILGRFLNHHRKRLAAKL
jgi:hypothetical protein